MFLQKTGTRFKHFISHQNNSIDETGNHSKDDCTITTVLPAESQHTRDASWLSQSPSSVLSALTSNTVATTQNRQIAPTVRTSRSSASSLCSCECGGANPDSHEHEHEHRHSLSKRPKSLSDAHYLPPLSPMKLFRDAETWRLIFPEEQEQSSSRPSTSPGKFDLRPSEPTMAGPSSKHESEATAAKPIPIPNANLRITTRPDQSLGKSVDSTTDNLSFNVEQLIKETDAAFQAVGSAIADAKALAHEWPSRPIEATKPTTPTEATKPEPQTLLPSRAVTRKPVGSSPPSALKSLILKSPLIKRKKHEKKLSILLDKKARKISPSSLKSPTSINSPTRENSARWTLMEMTANMADVFSGKIFRTDVDEMLTPERLEQIRKEACKDKYRSSSESAESDETDGVPTKESVRLEDLISPGPKLLPSPDLPPPAVPPKVPPKSEEQIQRAKPIEGRLVESIEEEEEDLAIGDVNFPSPPRAHGNHGRALLLPPIPEASPLTLTPPPSFGNWKTDDSTSSEYMDLRSTAFSLMSPYRHGPIRIERSHQSRESLVDEEPLDWTAFQVAISGTLDENDLWEFEEDETDDILGWWADFGFPGYGRLVAAPRRKKMKVEIGINVDDIQSPEENKSTHDCTSTKVQETPRDRSAIRDHSTTRDHKSIQDWRLALNHISTQDKRSSLAHRHSLSWKGGGWIMDVEQALGAKAFKHQKKQSMGTDSLPPSPMLDFSSLANVDGESVPMGFNLGHDLGDFLNWETYHVHNLNIDD